MNKPVTWGGLHVCVGNRGALVVFQLHGCMATWAQNAMFAPKFLQQEWDMGVILEGKVYVLLPGFLKH